MSKKEEPKASIIFGDLEIHSTSANLEDVEKIFNRIWKKVKENKKRGYIN